MIGLSSLNTLYVCLSIKEVTAMNITELLPQLRKLNRADKLYVMQFLVSELAQEETDLPCMVSI